MELVLFLRNLPAVVFILLNISEPSIKNTVKYTLISLLILFFAAPSVTTAQDSGIDQVSFDNSEVRIQGRSNLGEYECLLADLSNCPEKEVISTVNGFKVRLENNIIQVESNGVDCKNQRMNSDFRDAIKAEEHPYILLELKEFTLHGAVNQMPVQENIPSLIAITLAGITRSYEVDLEYFKFEGEKIILKGSKELAMSEYNIDAPSALFGLVKAEDAVKIDFLITFNLGET